MKRSLLIGVIVVLIVVVFLIFGFSGTGEIEERGTQIQEGQEGNLESSGEWLDFELEDVNTGEKFKISDFSGKPILLETFAVWCPTCTSQQKKIRDLHEEVGDSVVSISLDTDQNEDAVKVREHTQSNGFDWRYAISPIELTEALKDEFGTGIISAPSAPIVLICEDQSFRKLGGFGARSVNKLQDEINAGCN